MSDIFRGRPKQDLKYDLSTEEGKKMYHADYYLRNKDKYKESKKLFARQRLKDDPDYYKKCYERRKQQEAERPELRETRLRNNKNRRDLEVFVNQRNKENGEGHVDKNFEDKPDKIGFLRDFVEEFYVPKMKRYMSVKICIMQSEVVQDYYDRYNEIKTFEEIAKEKSMKKEIKLRLSDLYKTQLEEMHRKRRELGDEDEKPKHKNV